MIKSFISGALGNMIGFYWQAHARLFSMPLIYVIGDSHAAIFKNKKLFIARHIGAATMHNLAKENSSTKSGEKLFDIIGKINPKKDVVMLVFGEIDCRIHIYYQYEKQQRKFTIEELIDKTIANYGGVLEKIRHMGIRFCVYGVPAAGAQENYYKYPFYGTPQIRSYITKEFNHRLKKFCQENGYAFIDIYPKVSDANGFLLKEFSADEVHLNDKVIGFVRKEISNIFNL